AWEYHAASRSLRDPHRRFALCARRAHPAAGAQRARQFRRGFCAAHPPRRGRIRRTPMALLQELDTGTPIRVGAAEVTLTIDGRTVNVPQGTSVMAAAALLQ